MCIVVELAGRGSVNSLLHSPFYSSTSPHQAAHTAYTEALAIDKLNTLLNAKLYFWRATNAAKLNKLSDTVDDCTLAVQLDKGYTEAFVR